MLTAGFDQAADFVMPNSDMSRAVAKTTTSSLLKYETMDPGYEQIKQYKAGYKDTWAGVFAPLFAVVVYTMMYLAIVQKSFSLITMLPDRILRWIGGQPESIGGEMGQMAEEVKGKVAEGGKATSEGAAASAKQLKKGASKTISAGAKVLKGGGKGGGKKGGGGSGKGSGGGMGKGGGAKAGPPQAQVAMMAADKASEKKDE
jgi:defect-in-organelle-trafficking protein DotA